MSLKLVVSACQSESSTIYYKIVINHGVFPWGERVSGTKPKQRYCTSLYENVITYVNMCITMWHITTYATFEKGNENAH